MVINSDIKEINRALKEMGYKLTTRNKILLASQILTTLKTPEKMKKFIYTLEEIQFVPSTNFFKPKEDIPLGLKRRYQLNKNV